MKPPPRLEPRNFGGLNDKSQKINQRKKLKRKGGDRSYPFGHSIGSIKGLAHNKMYKKRTGIVGKNPLKAFVEIYFALSKSI